MSSEKSVCTFNSEFGREFSVTNIPSLSRNVTCVVNEDPITPENSNNDNGHDEEHDDRDSDENISSPDPWSDLDNSDLYDTDLDVIALKEATEKGNYCLFISFIY